MSHSFPDIHCHHLFQQRPKAQQWRGQRWWGGNGGTRGRGAKRGWRWQAPGMVYFYFYPSFLLLITIYSSMYDTGATTSIAPPLPPSTSTSRPANPNRLYWPWKGPREVMKRRDNNSNSNSNGKEGDRRWWRKWGQKGAQITKHCFVIWALGMCIFLVYLL